MVDIHSHIVYGVDDGAKTIEDSVAMLEMAAESGTTDIVATPHSDLNDINTIPNWWSQRIAEMQAASATASAFTGLRFSSLFTTTSRTARRTASRFTINGQRYLMVEFAGSADPEERSRTFSRT